MPGSFVGVEEDHDAAVDAIADAAEGGLAKFLGAFHRGAPYERGFFMVPDGHGKLAGCQAHSLASRKTMMRPWMRSPMRRKAAWRSCSEPSTAAGSSKGQCRRLTAAGKTGQVSLALSQTVITKSRSWPANSSTDLERWPEMSRPISAMTAMASGRTWEGLVPAEKTSKRSPASWRSRPSAIWERAELPVQRMRTRGFMGGPAVARESETNAGCDCRRHRRRA